MARVKFILIFEGQLISKCPYGAFKYPKKQTILLQDFNPSL